MGVVFGDTAANAAAFERQAGATWPSVVDPDEAIAISYGVDDPPQSFLIAPDGKVVDRILGERLRTAWTDLSRTASRRTSDNAGRTDDAAQRLALRPACRLCSRVPTGLGDRGRYCRARAGLWKRAPGTAQLIGEDRPP